MRAKARSVSAGSKCLLHEYECECCTSIQTEANARYSTRYTHKYRYLRTGHTRGHSTNLAAPLAVTYPM